MPFDLQNIEFDEKFATQLAAPRRAQTKKRFSLYRSFLKRGLDVALVLLTCVIALPIIGILALLVSLEGSSPFYSQLRVGRGGKNFRMIKLRTMVPNADALLAQHLALNPSAKAEWDATQKLKNDPRITRLGRFLRKTSLDELPQLFNVLLGHMSLVGPRPIMVQQKELYHGSAYYEMRPGLTGFWQVSDRNECEFSDRMKFDEVYNQMMSLSIDIAVMLRTVRVVLRGTGY